MKPIRIGLMGFGRIGRNLFRILYNRDDIRIAVEVSVTSSAAEVAEIVGKCVASGFDHVVVVGNDEAALGRGCSSVCWCRRTS